MKLKITDIRLGYRGQEVLRGCAYAFDEPGTYILTGENGSGKSTLLRVCALLEEPQGGAVEYYTEGEERPLRHDISLRRRLTLVLPRVGIFNASVLDNVAYGLRLRNAPEDELREKAAQALMFVGLAHKSAQNALTLSSGEAQRLGIARAIAIGPEALFLDEPTASVDAKSISAIEDIISGLRNENRLIIMTTHDERQAERLGDTVLRMEDGRIT